VLRPGALVSLQFVLGDSGVWANFTPWVATILPLAERYATPSLGRLGTTGGSFLFRGMLESILEAGCEADRLVSDVTYRLPRQRCWHWLMSRLPRLRGILTRKNEAHS
jgi:hypothetical protein